MKENAGLKKTPLFEEYKKHGAKVIDFGGWALPVHFTSILEEHEAVRTHAGLFDVSHMGEIIIEGAGAETFVNGIVTNDVSALKVHQAQYAVMCEESGGTVDDLLVYKLGLQKFMLVVNGANIDKDVDWIKRRAPADVSVTDQSSDTALLAVQGPESAALLQKLTETKLEDIAPFHFKPHVSISGVDGVLLSRTGYTGEDGFELYVASASAALLWQRLAKENLTLCGLGARDTLRLEAKLPLYGQELSPDITPLEAGIGFAVKTAKQTPFVGQEALQKQKEAGLTQKIIGIEMIGKSIPRTGYAVFSEEGEPIGVVTSGTYSPTLKKPIGLVLVPARFARAGTKLLIEVRKRRAEAVVVKTPFYKKSR